MIGMLESTAPWDLARGYFSSTALQGICQDSHLKNWVAPCFVHYDTLKTDANLSKYNYIEVLKIIGSCIDLDKSFE